MDAINKAALAQLKNERQHLTAQQYKTLKGQVLAGDPKGALQGLKKIKGRRSTNGDYTTRQGSGDRDRQQPKD